MALWVMNSPSTFLKISKHFHQEKSRKHVRNWSLSGKWITLWNFIVFHRERQYFLPSKNVQQNRWGSPAAFLAVFWLGCSDFPPSSSQNWSDSAPSFCIFDCAFGCGKRRRNQTWTVGNSENGYKNEANWFCCTDWGSFFCRVNVIWIIQPLLYQAASPEAHDPLHL